MLREAVGSLAFVEDLIRRENIACHYARTGRFTCAYSRGHYEVLAARADDVAKLTGGKAYMLPRERQREEIGSDHYRGGMVVEAVGSLHPALYVRGLADAARRAGAMLADKTRVTGLTRQAGGWRIRTDRGELVAREVMLATNAYTGAATPWFARRIIPVASFLIATSELSGDLAHGSCRMAVCSPIRGGCSAISDCRPMVGASYGAAGSARAPWTRG